MNFFAKGVYSVLDFFDFTEVVLLALICQFFKLPPFSIRQLVVPLRLNVVRNLFLIKMRHPLFDVVEVFVFEDLERSQTLLRHLALTKFKFELSNPF